jgi:hypothetical protein
MKVRNFFEYLFISQLVFISILLLTSCENQNVDSQLVIPSNYDKYFPPYLTNYKILKEARSRYKNNKSLFSELVYNLKTEADSWLDSSFATVTAKRHLPASGNKNDYYSIGVYWWPDTSKPDGLPYVRKDGFRNPEINEYDAPKLQKMIKAVNTLTLCFFYTEDLVYATKAKGFLNTWFINQKTKMNPHLEYGQAIPGINEGRGIGIIETADLVNVVDAVGILYRENILDTSELNEIIQWFNDYKNWLSESEKGKTEKNWHNNHGSSYDMQLISFSLFTADTLLARSILDSVIVKRIDKHIAEDGSQPIELKRSRGFHYSLYNLSFLFRIALLGERLGYDLWNYNSDRNNSLKGALGFMLPYIYDDLKWPYSQMDSMTKLQYKTFCLLIYSYNKFDGLNLGDYLQFHDINSYQIQKEYLVRPYYLLKY